jgi:hypothetical protein
MLKLVLDIRRTMAQPISDVDYSAVTLLQLYVAMVKLRAGSDVGG